MDNAGEEVLIGMLTGLNIVNVAYLNEEEESTNNANKERFQPMCATYNDLLNMEPNHYLGKNPMTPQSAMAKQMLHITHFEKDNKFVNSSIYYR